MPIVGYVSDNPCKKAVSVSQVSESSLSKMVKEKEKI